MAKKYIIEIDDGKNIIRNCGKTMLTVRMAIGKTEGSVNTGIELTPYTEPDDLEPVRKEAYEKGFNDGVILESNNNNAYNNGYHKGLIDAWGAARKIISMWDVTDDQLVLETFNVYCPNGESVPMHLFFDQSADEAIEKLEAYDKKQDNKIKVGNEVTDDKGDIGICTEICYPANSMHILYSDGTATDISLTGVTKTGNDYPEVVDLLKKMRGE